MKYKITYLEGDVENKTTLVEAENINNALVLFFSEHETVTDYTAVEVIE